MQDDLDSYPREFQALVKHPKCFGRMNAPDCSAIIKGPCGDEMEFYLNIEKGVIKEIKFYTNGCEATIACGEVTARLARGRDIDAALGISPKQVKDVLKVLPVEHKHCAILAVTTLYRALAEYLLQP
ncbi:MAG: iron-sulfur cluster assembly scaffold protein [Candidatus Omnitrophica bacterium]|nr:iron-sulfur cluster assembly scaffold protein [Candidatus Omnitrophota bacterium]